jgi:hypothetical protein
MCALSTADRYVVKKISLKPLFSMCLCVAKNTIHPFWRTLNFSIGVISAKTRKIDDHYIYKDVAPLVLFLHSIFGIHHFKLIFPLRPFLQPSRPWR